MEIWCASFYIVKAFVEKIELIDNIQLAKMCAGR